MIRRGTLEDVGMLQRIGIETFSDTFGNTCTKEDMRGVLELYFNPTQVSLELSDDADNFFFFEEEGTVKGYMRINAKHPCPIEGLQQRNCVELVRLYVLKEYHGTHVANALMHYALDFALAHGFDVMYLSVWDTTFAPAVFMKSMASKTQELKMIFPWAQPRKPIIGL